ncbi:hypothetical protein QCN29_25785 [Streptomyces sp. HNM0663]|uniref:Uncharacterized protein n=1 Tax=Streptomyces chengmaiensis TaxID=3040919 RepID=A0ABT6HV33_9ACTN|nr:hypothetical protein [Streptomyces chengmaiensis]MDH2392133.1 hypothetical protein [Streptomyces chengmaiensis]
MTPDAPEPNKEAAPPSRVSPAAGATGGPAPGDVEPAALTGLPDDGDGETSGSAPGGSSTATEPPGDAPPTAYAPLAAAPAGGNGARTGGSIPPGDAEHTAHAPNPAALPQLAKAGSAGYGDGPADPDPPGHAERTAHARIAAALAELAGGGGAGAPHPYLRRHLAGHAALGGVLDDTHVPPALLPWLSGDGVRGLLGLPRAGRAQQSWLAAWAAIEPYLRDADVASRRSSLHLAHTALRHPGVPYARLPQDVADFDGSRLRVLWSRWAPPANVLTTLGRRGLSLSAAAGPGGTPLLAVGNEAGGIELVDATTGAGVEDRIPAHDGAVRCLDFVPHATGAGDLVSGSADGVVRVWDTGRGTLVHHMALRRSAWIAAVAGYRDAEGRLHVAAAGGDGSVTLWREGAGERRLPELAAHPLDRAAFALTLATGADGRRLLVGAGRSLRVWDVSDAGDAAPRLVYQHPVDVPVRSCAGTGVPGGVATGHADGSLTLWDLAGGARAALPGEGEPVTALTALRTGDGRDLLAAAGPGTAVDLWDVGSRQWTGRLTGHGDAVTALCALPADGPARLASVARDNTVRLWDGQDLRRAVDGVDPAPSAVTATLAGRLGSAPRLAVGYASARVQLWDAGTGEPDAGFGTAPRHQVSALAWTPATPHGPGRLLWAAADCTVRAWDPAPRDPGRAAVPFPPLRGHSLPVRSLASAVLFDGRPVAVSGGDDCTVRLWDLTTGQQLLHWRHAFRVRAVAAASDGHGRDWVASGSTDGTVHVVEPAAGGPGRVLTCRQGFVNAVAFGADPGGPLPPFLVSGGDDGTVRLWDLTAYAPLGAVLRGHTEAVEAVAAWTAVTPSGARRAFAASAARDGTIRFWDAATSRCVLQLAAGSRVRALSAQGPALAIAGDAGVALLELDGDLDGDLDLPAPDCLDLPG